MADRSKAPVTLAEKVRAFLKLGDDGKVQSFFDREQKKVERSIKGNEKKIENAVYNRDVKLDAAQDSVADAVAEVENAYHNIDVELIKTNAAQDVFADTFWGNIATAEAAVVAIETEIEAINEAYEETAEACNEQITKLTARLNIITGTETEAKA